MTNEADRTESQDWERLMQSLVGNADLPPLDESYFSNDWDYSVDGTGDLPDLSLWLPQDCVGEGAEHGAIPPSNSYRSSSD